MEVSTDHDISSIRLPDAFFHQSQDYMTAKEEFTANSCRLVLAGLNGFGKLTIARRLAKEHRDEQRTNGKNFIQFEFESKNQNSLEEGIQELYAKLHCSSQYDPATTDLFSLVQLLNSEPFREKQKLFIFAHMSREMIDCTVRLVVDRIEGCRDKWQLLATTTHKLDRRGPLPVVEIVGFTDDDTIEFFRPSSTGLKLTDRQLNLLNQTLSGCPFALKIAQEQLKFETGDGDIVENYLQQLQLFGRRYLDDPTKNPEDDANILSVIGTTIKERLKGSKDQDVILDILKVLSFFDSKELTHEILCSCVEVVTDADKMDDVLGLVKNLIQFLTSSFLGTLADRRLNIQTLAKTTLKLFVSTNTVRAKYCRMALTALTRIMDHDGRFHRTQRYMLDHAREMIDYIRRNYYEFRADDFGITMKILYAELHSLIGYIYLERRDVQQGTAQISAGLDIMCRIVAEKSYDDLLDDGMSAGPEDAQASLIGRHLYTQVTDILTTRLTGPELVEFKNHIKNVPLYRRLTTRDMAALNVQTNPAGPSLSGRQQSIFNGHLTPKLLERCRDQGLVLRELTLQKTYMPEMLAGFFHLMARVRNFDFGYERVGLAADIQRHLMYAKIAGVIYSEVELLVRQEEPRLREDVLLDRIIVDRSERLMMELQLHEMYPGNITAVNSLQEEAEALQEMKGRGFELGLVRTHFLMDNYHRLLCNEAILLILGLRCRSNYSNELIEQGERLFKRCLDYAEQQPHKYKTQACAQQNYAHFQHLCGNDQLAVRNIIKAMMNLRKSSSRSEDDFTQPTELEKGFFKELCDNMAKYHDRCMQSESGCTLTVPFREYLSVVQRACMEKEMTHCAEIIQNVLLHSQEVMQVGEQATS